MEYNIKNHETRYSGVLFRSRLEARWAAYFDLLSWHWEYEPIDLDGWTPDFLLDIPCSHSECVDYPAGPVSGAHRLLIEVKPYFKIEKFKGHPCMDYFYGNHIKTGKKIPADCSAGFGIGPDVAEFECVHGHGGGIYSLLNWHNYQCKEIWNKAGEVVRYEK